MGEQGYRGPDVDASIEIVSGMSSRIRNQMAKASDVVGRAMRGAVYGARNLAGWEVQSRSV